MAAQKGKDLLLKAADDAGAFVTVAGLRARQIAFNAEAVDVTHSESAGRWRELLAGAGVRRASISGAGIFKDEASDTLVRQIFFDGAIRDWQVVVPGFGTIAGPFQLTPALSTRISGGSDMPSRASAAVATGCGAPSMS
ncbi:phage major tail protein, TP901-1 family [Bosea sp. CER48]|uniref:phage major tail protein, TP901-1 family n=1 Tax=Bosea sp. CER48 TaxID=3377035 RepID=UPI003821FD93